jgi:pimeloyl-ACP methyl ester carboxylesterase
MKKLFLLLPIFIVIGLSSCNKIETIESVSSNYSKIDSFQVHYKVHGDGDHSLIFVHGWGCDIKVWSEQFNYFKNKYRLVFIDLPGYGKSDKPHIEYTIDLFAKSVKKVTDDLNINKPVLIGHSLGFPVCKEAAKLYNNIEPILCNIDGVYFHFPGDSIEKVNYTNELTGFAAMFSGDGYKDNVDWFVNGFITERTPDNVKNYILSTMTQTPEYVGYTSMISLIDEKYWKENVYEIPTLTLYAESEELPEDNEEYLKFLFPNTTYYEMNGVGHFLMMEKPEEFNKILENFIINTKKQ